MSADCSLNSRGQNALTEDRRANYQSAPLAPSVINVDINPNAISDADNYRVDLLKKFCTTDVNNASGLSSNNLIDNLKEYGKNTTKNRDQILTDMNQRIEQLAANASDGANQIKYLLCQQVDSYIAPPRPVEQPVGSDSANILRNVYINDMTANWANWIFAILSFILIIVFLVNLYGKISTKTIFWIYVLLTFVFIILCLIVLFQNHCLPGQNRYYSPDESNPTQSTILVVLGIIVVLSGLCIGMGKIFKNKPWGPWLSISGFSMLMILGLSTDFLFALFQPQGFVIAVIFLRMITWMANDTHPWSLPTLSVINIVRKTVFPDEDIQILGQNVGQILGSNVQNETMFGWIRRIRDRGD
jgi:hypothetical protein